MSWWERVKQVLKREAADVKDMAKSGFESLDAELARKERELEASPAERVDMLLEQTAAEDERLAALEDKVRRRVSQADGTEEISQVVEPEHAVREDPPDPPDPELAGSTPPPDVATTEKAPPEAESWPIDQARPWVSVRDTTSDDGMPEVFNHAVAIADQAGSVLGADGIAAVVDDVDFHPLVLEVQENGGLWYVRAPTLATSEVNELFLDAIVARLPPPA